MIKNVLWRVKKLLGITDSQDDEKIILLIENAMLQFRNYMHNDNLDGLEPLLAMFVGHLLTSGEGAGAPSTISSSSSSSTGGGGVTPVVGEVKSVAYSGVQEVYTTSADFVSGSSSSSSTSSGTSSSGDALTYFNSFIAPQLRGRRKIMTLSHPYVEESPERY